MIRHGLPIEDRHRHFAGVALDAPSRPVFRSIDFAIGVAGESRLQVQRPQIMLDPAGQLDHPLRRLVAHPPGRQSTAEFLVPDEVAVKAGAQLVGLLGGEAADADDHALGLVHRRHRGARGGGSNLNPVRKSFNRQTRWRR